MGDYHLLPPRQEDRAGDGGAASQRRSRETLRLVAGSTAAIALLVACAYTTLRGKMDEHSEVQPHRDTELVRSLSLAGLAPYADADGLGQFVRRQAGADAERGAPQSLSGSTRNQQLNWGLGTDMCPRYEGEWCPPEKRCVGKYCAHGRLSIDDITPSTCVTEGGCMLKFKGRNIVSGGDLYGHRADELMSVILLSGDIEVSRCTSINWIDFMNFECTVGAGVGHDLMWNVSIPHHDKKEKNHGMGWTWAGDEGFRGSGRPCQDNNCGFYFTYTNPSINAVEPSVVDVGEETIILVHGSNFGEHADNLTAEFNGQPCLEIELVNDHLLRCLAVPVMEPGFVTLKVTIGGQASEVQIPSKDIPDSPEFPFTSSNTFETEEWNITMAAIMGQTGLEREWFNNHQAQILRSNPAQSIAGIMANTGFGKWEAVAVQLFRQYLKSHFAADAGHGVEDENGVYISNLGNKLDGDVHHDQQVMAEQLQVMEAATGESRQQLAHVVGDVVETDPPCAGYPNCQPADAVGHRGWTWHWGFDPKRESWTWEYAAISDGKEPPISCGYCDPVKVHAAHPREYAKTREETCMHCVQNSFANIDACQCADFKAMCLQTSDTHPAMRAVHRSQQLNGRLGHAHAAELPAADTPAVDLFPVAASSPLVDPPYGETECAVIAAADKCEAIGGIPSSDGIACCPAQCGACGGHNCGHRDGGAALCCHGHVTDAGVKCGEPPCVMEDSIVENIVHRVDACASAFKGVMDAGSLQCCAASCVACGGPECESAPGGAQSCCLDQVSAQDKMCSVDTQAPCTMKAGGGPGSAPGDAYSGASDSEARVLSVSEACLSVGGIPDPFGQICCSSSCGACGGMECERRPGGGDACCVDNIVDAHVSIFLLRFLSVLSNLRVHNPRNQYLILILGPVFRFCSFFQIWTDSVTESAH